MDDKRNKEGKIEPVAACHGCPGHEAHMKGADLPDADPNHRSAISIRAMEIKNQNERLNIQPKLSPKKSPPERRPSARPPLASRPLPIPPRLARRTDFQEYLGHVLARKM
ncbi:hypothetical protein EAE96_002584 [Botrytis aclada]|nr:hypothetical protein EAE96_002584 [Botrytis aclada]